MDEKNKKILDIPDITFRGEDNEFEKQEKSFENKHEPNFVLVSQDEQKQGDFLENNNYQEVQPEAVSAVTQSDDINKSEQKIYAQVNVQPENQEDTYEGVHAANSYTNIESEQEEKQTYAQNTEQQAVSPKIPSWRKIFATSMAGAIVGCSVFTGGYVFTTSLFKDDKPTNQTSTPSSSYIEKASTSTATSEVVAAVEPGIVTVLTGDRMRNLTGNGSGVVYKNEDGKIYILTNAHVVADASVVEVYRNDLGADSSDAVEVLAVDTENDIAVLVMKNPEHEYPVTIDFEDSNNLQVGQKVIAIGSPYVATLGTSFSGSVTEGIISGLNREVSTTSNTSYYQSKQVVQKYIQTDAAINGGNSGGALIDMNGNLVGINSAKISSAENMGLAISASDVVQAMKAMNVPLPNVVAE